MFPRRGLTPPLVLLWIECTESQREVEWLVGVEHVAGDGGRLLELATSDMPYCYWWCHWRYYPGHAAVWPAMDPQNKLMQRSSGPS
jgi:hypothetical protein